MLPDFRSQRSGQGGYREVGGGGRKGEDNREGEKEGGRVGDREREGEREVGIPLYLLMFKIAGVQKGSEYGLRSHVI